MWADLPGYFDYAELYDAQVAAAADGAVFVEIGVWHGRSIIYLANSIRTSGKRIRLCGVDNFQDPPQSQVAANLADCGVADTVELIASDSAAAAERFAPHAVDFAFIDADHSYDAVKRDIAAWRPRIKPGGILAGHDRMRSSVAQAVIEVFGSYRTSGPEAWWVQL